MSRTFSFSDGGKYCKNTIAFIADMSSSGQIDNRKKEISIFDKSPTQGLHDTKLTAEKEML